MIVWLAPAGGKRNAFHGDLRCVLVGLHKHSRRKAIALLMDLQVAKTLGFSPGSIMVHGLPNYVTSPRIRAEYLTRDWTNGCIAVTNEEMEEIWMLVPDGTPIEIKP